MEAKLSVWLVSVVNKHYQPITGAEAIKCDGAQQLNGQWLMPLSGCDTLANMLEDIEHAAGVARNKQDKGGRKCEV
jgi:hypothetical protein